jgi:predicted helicase
VEILDPAVGTGTFICELLEHFRGQKAKLKHKYLEELHANEVAILIDLLMRVTRVSVATQAIVEAMRKAVR